MTNQVLTPEKRLEELGYTLTTPRKPIGNYVSCVRTGNLIFTSGQGTDEYRGKLGQDCTVEEGYEAARQCMLNLLSVIKHEIGDLSKVKRVVKILGFVNSAPDFTDQPKVLNGASDLLVQVFGEKGKHGRSAVGMAQLPNNNMVEVEMIVEIEGGIKMNLIEKEQMKIKDAKLFINGEYRDAMSGETFDTIDPATNRKLASVAQADERDAKEAIEVAQRTFESGVWSNMSVDERAAILCRMSDLILERVDELALVETLDVGKPIKESRGFDIPRAAANLRFFAEMAKYINQEHYQQHKHMSYSQYAPAGVTSLIIPWNLPFMQMTWKAGAALAVGNTVVVKPASYTPLSAVMLGEIANEAGLPPGVLNIITGPGGSVGTAMTYTSLCKTYFVCRRI